MTDCPMCEAGSPTIKVSRIPYRRARRNEKGEVEPYGPVMAMEMSEEKARKVREMMARYEMSEMVMIDLD